ncbi:hypothetical protein DERF_016737 [Dermatophagoides farinae]|uniref:Uncharacterized protein n=1 Tax=Dermatophagoides farinae TaxID=6954 RepID=A0A922HMI0_DERFA|nr:hypothetical protein DERF_016737 [Dermatophagoides farinae]
MYQSIMSQNCCNIDYYVWNSTVKNLSLHQNQYKIINLNLFGIDFDEPTILFNGHHHHHHSRISKIFLTQMHHNLIE